MHQHEVKKTEYALKNTTGVQGQKVHANYKNNKIQTNKAHKKHKTFTRLGLSKRS